MSREVYEVVETKAEKTRVAETKRKRKKKKGNEKRKSVKNFIQLVSLQLVDQFSQNKLH